MSFAIKESAHATTDASSNGLLASLASKGHGWLAAQCEEVSLSCGEILHAAGEPIEYVYFPSDSVVSLLSAGESDAVEVGMVGGEGMVGAAALLGSTLSPHRAVVLQSGGALRAKVGALRREFRRSQEVRDRLLPHAHALLTQNAQSALCHRFHTPRERLCRWFLTVHDRAGSDVFRATQEFISGMLGTRRATVTEVAHELQEQGLIDYRRGRVHVRDRPRIEELVCHCYFVIRQEMEALKAGRDGDAASCQTPERIS